jgi:hypothetical protein
MTIGTKPWQLWGNVKIIECIYGNAILPTVSSQQLNRIAYKRPESWGFFFSAQLLQADIQAIPPKVDQQVEVKFNLTLGVGMTSLTIPGFEFFRFFATAPNILAPRLIYSSMAIGPDRLGGATTQPGVNEVRAIVAEDIQLNADVSFNFAETAGDRVVIELKTFFAPIAHVRPEWSIGNFPGGENA